MENLTQTNRFYKDESGWYVDLQYLIDNGTFTKENLALVCGADTFLDKIAGKKKSLNIKFSNTPFEEYEYTLVNTGEGMDEEALVEANHPIQLGGYYKAIEFSHDLWLCEVCSYIFGGEFPPIIYVKKIK